MHTYKQIIKKIVPSFLINIITYYKYRIEWKRHNKNNKIIPVRYIPVECAEIGNYSYGKLNVLNCKDNVKIKIGRFCSIADDVTFCLSVDHILNNLSTYPFISLIQGRNNEDAISKGNIIVEDDVWIGYRATIMSGVKIGQGAVIAAGAVVTKDIPPYAIVGGVPAKVIKYRFSNEIISQLIKVNYANIEDMIKNSNFNILYTHINEDNIDDILDNLNHPERQ